MTKIPHAVNVHDLKEHSYSLFDSPDFWVGLLSLAPGQGIQPHLHPVDVLLLALEGKGTFIMGEEELEAKAGTLVVIPSHIVRGVMAKTPMRVLVAATKRGRQLPPMPGFEELTFLTP